MEWVLDGFDASYRKTIAAGTVNPWNISLTLTLRIRRAPLDGATGTDRAQNSGRSLLAWPHESPLRARVMTAMRVLVAGQVLVALLVAWRYAPPAPVGADAPPGEFSAARAAAMLRRAIVTHLRTVFPTMKNEAMREVVWNESQARRMTWAENGSRVIAYRALRFLMHAQ